MTRLEAAVKELKYRGLVPGSNGNKGKWEVAIKRELSAQWIMESRSVWSRTRVIMLVS